MGARMALMECCQDERLPDEVYLDLSAVSSEMMGCTCQCEDSSGHPNLVEAVPASRQGPSDGVVLMPIQSADVWPRRSLEPLSYVPTQFDEDTTVDMKRSQARYQKVVGQRSSAKGRGRGCGWREWLHDECFNRRAELLLSDCNFSSGGELCSLVRFRAMYYLDQAMVNLMISPENGATFDEFACPLKSIQSICSPTDMMIIFQKAAGILTEAELERTISVQYVVESVVEDNFVERRKRFCLLEESAEAKNRLVEVLTELWCEKQNANDMWF